MTAKITFSLSEILKEIETLDLLKDLKCLKILYIHAIIKCKKKIFFALCVTHYAGLFYEVKKF